MVSGYAGGSVETTRDNGGMAGGDLSKLSGGEWLVANGLGGYASSTIPCLNTRKYHGLLVAAMSPPVRRMAILSRVEETVVFGGSAIRISLQRISTNHPSAGASASSRRSRCRAVSRDGDIRAMGKQGGWTVEKQLRLLPGRNAVLLTYTVWGGSDAGALELRPLVLALRPIHELMYQWNGPMQVERLAGHALADGQYRVAATSRTPEVFFAHGGEWEAERGGASWYLNTIYRREQQRGYAGLEDLWCPGIVHLRLSPGVSAHFVCSTDPMSVEDALAEIGAKGLKSEKSEQGEKALDITPKPTAPRWGRPNSDAESDTEISTLLRAAETFAAAPTFPPGKIPVLADYHWAAPSPRNALIGFTGLYLVTGRLEQGRALLLALAGLMKEGLIPATLAEDRCACRRIARLTRSLWFVNVVWNYLRWNSG